MHFPADWDCRNDEEQHNESHSRLLNKLCNVPTCATAHEFGRELRTPEEHFCSDNQHAGKGYHAAEVLLSRELPILHTSVTYVAEQVPSCSCHTPRCSRSRRFVISQSSTSTPWSLRDRGCRSTLFHPFPKAVLLRYHRETVETSLLRPSSGQPHHCRTPA